MNALLEPRLNPQQVPEMMLLDEEEAGGGWVPGLAEFCAAAVASAAATGAPASAPVPICSSARAQRMSPGSELVDSLESTQTLLGASLAAAVDAAAVHSAPAGSPGGSDPWAMRFVPVPLAPPPQPYAQPQPAAERFWGGERDEGLYGGYGAVAPPQLPPPASFRPYGGRYATQYDTPDQQYDAAAHDWRYVAAHDAPLPRLPLPAPHAWEAPQREHSLSYSGVSSYDMPFGYSAQFGGAHAPLPMPAPMRRAVSDTLLAAHHDAAAAAAYERGLLAAVAEGDSLGSEGSDGDTLADHHSLLPRGLPASHSAPSASLMALERSASNRRSALPSPGGRASHAASPRPICLKVKAGRPRPAGGSRASGSGGHRPSRLSARRSIALSAAAAAEEGFGSDSEAEPEPSAGGSEERRSGGSAGCAAPAPRDGAAGGKKKHNPWSLTETEALVEGVRLLGPSKWAEIKKLGVSGIADLLAARSAVDLKDKWRNLTRVAKLPKSVLKARAHKSTSDIPLELLLTVKDLMEMSRD